MKLAVSDRVVIRQPQVHGNCSVLRNGKIMSIAGSNAVVSVEGELTPRAIALQSLTKQSALLGDSFTGRPNEKPIVNAMR